MSLLHEGRVFVSSFGTQSGYVAADHPMLCHQHTTMFRIARRYVATATKTATETATQTAAKTVVAPVDPLDVIPSSNYPQSPNHPSTWSASQRSRDAIYKNDPRFVGMDLSKQPQALAAIELIKNQPVNFIKHNNIAVCNGTDFSQGHPKVYINLDKNKVHHCGYCGAKYARAELEGKL